MFILILLSVDNIILNNFNIKCIIAGDYNLPKIKWTSVHNGASTVIESVCTFEFNILSYICHSNLNQISIIS